MPVSTTSRIRRAVVAALEAVSNNHIPGVGDLNTVGDFWPGSTDLPPAIKGRITRTIKVNCGIEDTAFSWPGTPGVTIGELVDKVQDYQH